MSTLLVAYCIAAACIIAGLLGMCLRRRWLKNRELRNEALRERYMGILLRLLVGGGPVPAFIEIRSAGARVVLAEVLAGVVSATYGLDPELIGGIVEHYKLDRLLLQRARWSCGYKRAYYLSLLASLPVSEDIVAKIAPWGGSRNRYVRFYAMLVQIAADVPSAIRLMEAYRESFSAFEISEITTLLRRGALPLAYEPLVGSSSRNLCAVGLSIVRQFGIEEAEPALLTIIGRKDAPELSLEALYTLCSLHRSLECREVALCVGRMSADDRRALLRYMALEGYAPQSLERLLDPVEQRYFEILVESYKRCLVCS